ncbi:MAG: tetratricopeptide repeat protein [Elusimicrobiales bacterium]|nr:tetratricopeptide repeat protein [Elusimicrobiales bacterium]
MPILINHPASVDMSGYRRIAIGEFTGSWSESAAGYIKERLVDGGIYSVTDRSQLNQILHELKINQSDFADPKFRIKLGRLLSSAALIIGRGIEVRLDEEVQSQNMTCTSVYGSGKTAQRVSLPCTQYTKTCTARSFGAVDLIDVQTGSIIKSSRFGGRCSERGSAIDGVPQCPSKPNALESCALTSDLNYFLSKITPWQERRLVPFSRDSDMPSLELGIRHAQMGEMKEAIKTFHRTAKAAEVNPELKPAQIAKAYWNLGLAFEYSSQYDQALKYLKKAYLLYPYPPYLHEQDSVRQMQKNEEELKKQGLDAK